MEYKKWWGAIGIVVLLLLFDQAIKIWIKTHFQLYESVDKRSDQLNSLSHTTPASFLRWMKIRKRKE